MRTVGKARLSWMSALLACLVAPGPAPGDDAKVIPAAEARRHVDEERTVAMTVKASKNGLHRRTWFLDSEEDYRDEKNLAVLIDHDHGEAFRAAGVDDPAEYYRGKSIRVTGKILAEEGQTRIRVTGPDQIKVVEPSAP